MQQYSKKTGRKLKRKAQASYFTTCSCSLTQLRPFQDEFDLLNDDVLKAAMPLSGGLFSKGSTCGVVFSAALTLAMLMDKEIPEWNQGNEIILQSQIKEFMKWFKEQYSTTLCRERTECDLWTRKGILGLFLPKNLIGCLTHIGGTSKYLYNNKDNLPEVEIPSSSINSFHCAKKVLETIREQTGIGNDVVERISIALDGGVGLQGDACGAIAGAVMAIGLKFSKNMRETNMLGNMGRFLSSAKRYRKQKSNEELFSVGGKFMENISEITTCLECKEIIHREFSSWEDFQQFGNSDQSKKCQEIINFVSAKAIELLKP